MAEWARPPRSPTPPGRIPPPPFEEPEFNPNQLVVSSNPETYVVQVPKDQIYRVPPPENASIAERYRNNQKRSHKRNPCLACIGWTLVALLLLFVLFLIASFLFYVVVGPAIPLFTIDSLAARSSGSEVQFNIRMNVENPSKKLRVGYDVGGKATLMYRSTSISKGRTPELYQDSKEINPIALTLHGSNAALPPAIDRSLHGKVKGVIPLKLMIDFIVNFKVGGLKLWDMGLGTFCDVQVSGLGNKTKIESQECKAKLRL